MSKLTHFEIWRAQPPENLETLSALHTAMAIQLAMAA